MQKEIEYIRSRYIADDGNGDVNWCDMRILSLIEKLVQKVAALEEKVEALENPAEYPPGHHDEKRSEWSGGLFSY